MSEMPVVRVLIAPFSLIRNQTDLVLELAKREILGRYRGAAFGLFWSLLAPFLMLLVYSMAFGYILKSRWPGTDGSTGQFLLILFVGLIVHGFFAECLTRAPQLVLGNPSYVKKVVFPLDALSWSMVLSAMFHLAMNALVLFGMMLFFRRGIPPTALLLPVVLLPLLTMSLGIGFLLSAAGVYVRDIGQFVGVIASAMYFLSSAIVPVQALPENYRPYFYINPLTSIIDQARDVAIWGKMPDWTQWGTHLLCSLAFMIAAHWAFQKMRRGFGDVL